MKKGSKRITNWEFQLFKLPQRRIRYARPSDLYKSSDAFGIMFGIALACISIRSFFIYINNHSLANAQTLPTEVAEIQTSGGDIEKRQTTTPPSTTEGDQLLGQQDPEGTSPSASSKQEIIEYIVEVFKEDAPDAFNILYCENRNLNPKAVNHNRNGSRDLGIFQLNDRYHGGEENFDYKTNIDKAYKIFERQGWRPWTCAHRIGEKNYLSN